MYKIYLISYATKEFRESQKKLAVSAKRYGVVNHYLFKKKNLKRTEFYRKNKEILDQKRGAGYWLWKPFFISEVLKNINEGDILLYCDSGVEIINDLSCFIDELKDNDCLFFNTPMSHKKWTKKDCFVLMDCDLDKYHEAIQTMSGIIFVKKTKFTVKLINEWIYFAKDKHILTDLPNICGLENDKTFKEHRHDQSILTNLVIKYNLITFSYTETLQYFNIHRTRKINYIKRIKLKIKKNIA